MVLPLKYLRGGRLKMKEIAGNFTKLTGQRSILPMKGRTKRGGQSRKERQRPGEHASKLQVEKRMVKEKP